MSTEDLIRMANQIAAFFAGYPEPEAVSQIRDHVRRFWEPRMRHELKEHIGNGGEGLTPSVISAFREVE